MHSAPKEVAPGHCKIYNVAVFSLNFEWTTVKAQRDKISSWSARNAGERDWSEVPSMDGSGPVV